MPYTVSGRDRGPGHPPQRKICHSILWYILGALILGVSRHEKGVKLSGLENMHGSTYGLQPQTKNKETTKTLLGRLVGGTKGRMVLQLTVQNGERIDPGDPVYPTLFNITVDAVVNLVLL